MDITGLCFKVAFLSSLATQAAGQTSRSLTDYLVSSQWQVTSSRPMIVVDPVHTLAKTSEITLKAYSRMTAQVGGLTAIVPTEMVLIDDSLVKPPNLYDGMPEFLKVMYLLSTLNPEQLNQATGDGIGLNDLRGEQANVFKSIVSPGLDWATYVVGQDGIHDKLIEQGSVPEDQLDQIKIKFQSGLVIGVPQQSNPNSYNTYEPLWGNGRSPDSKPGEKWTARREPVYNVNFGADPRKTVPNVSKPSALNYSDPRFDVLVSLPSQSTIKDVLQAVGTATRLEILSDIRVSDLTVCGFGSKARAGDLLKAIALCVTGTFRKVDSAYELTSDLVGMGARALKFAAWAADIQKELFRRQLLWQGQIARTGAIDKIRFDPNDHFAPDDQLGKSLNTGAVVPNTQLTTPIHNYITQLANSGPSTGLATDHVSLESEVRYAFVLPNGQPLSPEYQSLGRRTFFQVPGPQQPEDEDKAEMFPVGSADKQRLLVRAESESEVAALSDLARTHGFSQLWLETHQQTVLLAALKQGLKVSLAIRPWEAPPSARVSSKDLDVLGDTGTQLAIRRASEPEWQAYAKQADFWSGPPAVYDFASPCDPELQKRWIELASLAHTPGLSGVVVLDTEPPGYEPNKHEGMRQFGDAYSPWMAILHEFGYVEPLRLGFLREHGVDPLDVVSPDLVLGFNISQPFLIDQRLGLFENPPSRAAKLMEEVPFQWYTFRAELNAKAIQSFMDMFADISEPMFVTPRSSTTHVQPSLCELVMPWTPGQALPQVYPTGVVNSSVQIGITMSKFDDESTIRQIGGIGYRLKYPQFAFAFDVTDVQPKRLSKLLDRWFPKTVVR